MNKAYLLTFPLLLLSLAAMAQGEVRGVALDSAAAEPLPFATVVLKKASDGQLVRGMQTLDDGVFVFTAVPFGDYELQVSFVGYTTATRAVQLRREQPLVDVGGLLVREASEVLEAVVVSAAANTFSMQADKQVFDADKMEGVAGGSAVDLLRQIPMVEIDADDNVQMRGMVVTVTVDGRPSPYPDVQTTMQMLPADAVERVEVITNPSARYQSEGSGGIINIVLKKNMVRGYNAAVNVSYAHRARQRAGVTLNYREGKVNYFFSANGSHLTQRYDVASERANLRADTVYEWVGQRSHMLRQTAAPTGVYKLGFDYFFDDKNSITLSELVNISSMENTDAVSMHHRHAPSGLEHRRGVRRNEAENRNASYVTEANYRHAFDPKVEHELTADLRYTYEEYGRNSSYQTQMQRRADSLSSPPQGDEDAFYDEELRWQTKLGGVQRNLLLAKSDYVHPLGKEGKLELGVSANNHWNKTRYDAERLHHGALPFIPDSTQAERYTFVEQTYAAYCDVAHTLGKLGYKLGVRLEQSFLNGETQLPSGATAVVNTPYRYAFPSAFLTYHLSDDRRLVASYSARIARPSFLQLVPYSDVSNLQSIRLGSPHLRPAYTHSVELSFMHFHRHTRNMLNLQAYFSGTQDVIQRIHFTDDVRRYVPDAAHDTVNVSRLENVGRNNVVGANAIFRYRQVKNLTVAATLNGSYSAMQGVRGGQPYRTARWSGRTTLAATYHLPLDVVAHVAGRYALPTLTAQGYAREHGTVDVSLRRMFFQKTLTATVALYDALNTYRYVSYSAGSTFEATAERTQSSRQLRFTLMYKFGKLDTEGLSRRSRQSVELLPEEPPRGRGL